MTTTTLAYPDDSPDYIPPESRYAAEALLALYEHLRISNDVQAASDIAVEIDPAILLEDDGLCIDHAVIERVAEIMTDVDVAVTAEVAGMVNYSHARSRRRLS